MTFNPPDPSARLDVQSNAVPPPSGFVAPQDSGASVAANQPSKPPEFGVPVLPGMVADGTLRDQSPDPSTQLVAASQGASQQFLSSPVETGTDSATPGATGEQADLEPLTSIGWLRGLTFALWILSPAVGILLPAAGLSIGASGFLCLVVWSYLAVANARRATPPSGFSKAPSPIGAVVRWFRMPILVSIGAGFIRGMLFVLIESPEPQGGLAADSTGSWNLFTVGIWIASAALPIIVWFVSGNRAMEELEHAAQLSWDSKMKPGGGMDYANLGERFRLAELRQAGITPDPGG